MKIIIKEKFYNLQKGDVKMEKRNIVEKLVKRNQFKELKGNIEPIVIETICKTPYKLLTVKQYKELFTDQYEPGTFYLSERMDNTDFLFDEPQQSFYDWFKGAIGGELKQLKTVPHFFEKLKHYGEDILIEDAYQILFFKTMSGKVFCEVIPNQEYSDIFRRIILFLIYDNPNYEINTYIEFNRIGKKLIPHVLERGKYTLKERLIQSIYSGLIGMDIKDELAATSPLSRNKIIPLKGQENDLEKVSNIFSILNEVAKRDVIDIDSWESFESKVVNCRKKTSLCWFTDDYIPTLFEMKFIEELLSYNFNLHVTIIPRVQAYSNDASWRDVEEFMGLSIFSRLSNYRETGRFQICHGGLSAGTFNGKKLSEECADIMIACDYVVIAGARSYEMGQGINKPTFFTGIAICRTYSETVTGICKDDGGIVFLEQLPGTKSFEGFRNRGRNKKYCAIHDRWFPVASKTAIDYWLNNNAKEE